MLFRFDDRPPDHLNPRLTGGMVDQANTPSAHFPDVRRRIEHDIPAAGVVERALAEAAALLTAADPAAIDEAIVECFAQLASLMALTRVQLCLDVASDAAVPTHEFPVPLGASGTVANITAVPAIRTALMRREPACFSSLDEIPADRRELFHRCGIVAGAVLPVTRGRAAAGALILVAGSPRSWPPRLVDLLRAFAAIIGQALSTRAQHQAMTHAQEHLDELRAQLARVGDEPRPSTAILRASSLIVSESAAIRQAIAQAEQVASSSATVLLMGETGVGKEVFAQMIHRLSARHQRPMVSVSCGAIPSALIESELFGRERGAYTGALTRQIGRFEAANQSTLFLDEIGELSSEVQIKLLRVLQERVIERLGSTQQIRVDVRIIAATNRNLEKAVEDKNFREDLFYRLNVFPITIPPLRERVEDLPGLVWDFIDEFSKQLGKTIESISEESMRQLRLYPWPGNVRELRNVIERAVIVSTGPRLNVSIPENGGNRAPLSSMTLKGLETEHIRETLERTHWRIRGRGGAAERLGLKPTTLEGRMAKLGLTRPQRP